MHVKQNLNVMDNMTHCQIYSINMITMYASYKYHGIKKQSCRNTESQTLCEKLLINIWANLVLEKCPLINKLYNEGYTMHYLYEGSQINQGHCPRSVTNPDYFSQLLIN